MHDTSGIATRRKNLWNIPGTGQIQLLYHAQILPKYYPRQILRSLLSDLSAYNILLKFPLSIRFPRTWYNVLADFQASISSKRLIVAILKKFNLYDKIQASSPFLRFTVNKLLNS